MLLFLFSNRALRSLSHRHFLITKKWTDAHKATIIKRTVKATYTCPAMEKDHEMLLMRWRHCKNTVLDSREDHASGPDFFKSSISDLQHMTFKRQNITSHHLLPFQSLFFSLFGVFEKECGVFLRRAKFVRMRWVLFCATYNTLD